MENVIEAFNDFFILMEKKLIGRSCVHARGLAALDMNLF